MKICERIDGSVACFAQADENVVDDGTPRIRNIEGYKFDDRCQITDDNGKISSAFPRFCA